MYTVHLKERKKLKKFSWNNVQLLVYTAHLGGGERDNNSAYIFCFLLASFIVGLFKIQACDRACGISFNQVVSVHFTLPLLETIFRTGQLHHYTCSASVVGQGLLSGNVGTEVHCRNGKECKYQVLDTEVWLCSAG